MNRVSPFKLGEFRQVAKDWDGCRKCRIGRWALNKCHVRGIVPCDILIIGEAPSRADNFHGKPMMGSAGKLLNRWVNDLISRDYPSLGFPPRIAIATVVACRPCDTKEENTRRPTKKEVKRCAPHLEQVVSLCDPQGIILLGKAAKHYIPAHSCIRIKNPLKVLHSGGFDTESSRRVVDIMEDFIRKVVVPF